MGAEVLKWMKPDARGTDVRYLRVEREHRLTQGEVASGPRLGTGQMTRQIPVRAPLPQSTQSREALLDLIVR